VRIEDDDRIILGGQLFNNSSSGPTLTSTSHRENGQVPGDDGVTVDLHIDFGPVRKRRNVECSVLPVLKISKNDPDDVLGTGSICARCRLWWIAEVIQPLNSFQSR